MAKARQVEQVPLEFRFGHGVGPDGRLGQHRGALRYVDPSVADWFRNCGDLGTSPELGSVYIYAGPELISECTRSGAVQAPTETDLRPVDAARVEVLRAETRTLEARREALTGQVDVDERRLRALQAEIAAIETRIVQERDRCRNEIDASDRQLRMHLDLVNDQKKALKDDLDHFREHARISKKFLEDELNHAKELHRDLADAEADNARAAAKRKALVVLGLTDIVEKANEAEIVFLLQKLSASNNGGKSTFLQGVMDSGIVDKLGAIAERIVEKVGERKAG